MRFRFGWIVGLAGLVAVPAAAVEAPLSEALIGPQLVEEMRKTFSTKIVVMSLRGANVDRKDMTQAQIDDYDTRWRAEREAKAKPLITSTLTSPLSNYATRIQAHSNGLIVEIIIVGLKGLNVGQSSITGDMWQGDEAKFQRTAALGPGRVFIDKAEYHDGSGTWRAQLNLTIDDPDTGEPIGAVTIEINLTELDRRLKL